MSRKYIKELINTSFVYPNKIKKEYDTELIHNIYEDCVDGNLNSLSATTLTSQLITLSADIDWSLNNSKPFIMGDGNYAKVSVHVLAPNQNYFKPWVTVDYITGSTTASLTNFVKTINITPQLLGLSELPLGTYYFEFRLIGDLCYIPLFTSLNISVVPSTPTPTPTITLTPTVTPTQGVTSTPTPTPSVTPSASSEKSLILYGRDVDASPSNLTLFYSVNSGGNINVPGYTGGQLPSSCTPLYTITGLMSGDTVQIGTSIACVINGTSGTSCPSSSGSAITYTYTVGASTTQSAAITIDSGTIP